jgi:hypothetical protein
MAHHSIKRTCGGISTNRECFFIGGSILLLFDDGMSAVVAATAAADPIPEPSLLEAELEQSADRVSARTLARRLRRAKRDELRAAAASVAIAFSLFFALLVAALLVGGQAVLEPLLHSAAALGEANRVGQIVYTMPDRVFCRHLSFDNRTAEIAERAIDQCPNDLNRVHSRGTAMGFAWGGR